MSGRSIKRMILVGACGAMGRVVAGQSYEHGFEIVAGIDHCLESDLPFPLCDSFDKCGAEHVDVIIDFSHPAILPDLLCFAEKRKLPIVIATTGMSDRDIASIEAASAGIPIFFSFNMSIGVSLMASLVKQAAAALGNQFEVEIIERHHNRKIDAPSGTAIMLANTIRQAVGDGDNVYERASKRQKRGDGEIGIHSVRAGNIVGEHEVLFAGNDELITISHSARSKAIFATGAYRAAHFIMGKKPGIYDMNDLVGETY